MKELGVGTAVEVTDGKNKYPYSAKIVSPVNKEKGTVKVKYDVYDCKVYEVDVERVSIIDLSCKRPKRKSSKPDVFEYKTFKRVNTDDVETVVDTSDQVDNSHKKDSHDDDVPDYFVQINNTEKKNVNLTSTSRVNLFNMTNEILWEKEGFVSKDIKEPLVGSLIQEPFRNLNDNYQFIIAKSMKQRGRKKVGKESLPSYEKVLISSEGVKIQQSPKHGPERKIIKNFPFNYMKNQAKENKKHEWNKLSKEDRVIWTWVEMLKFVDYHVKCNIFELKDPIYK